MKKIFVYSVAYNRPDFIVLQAKSIFNYLKISNSDYEISFRVLVNTKDKVMQQQLVEECKKINVDFSIVPHKETQLYNGGLTAYNYIRDHYFPMANSYDYSIIMDSDMFFYNGFGVEKIMKGADVAAIYHQREKKIWGFTRYNYEYLWVGFMIFSHKKFSWKEINFDPVGAICDVGGMTIYYLRKNLKNGLQVKWLKHTADIGHEYKVIFPEKLRALYQPEMGSQIIEDAIFHYYRGTNWNGNDAVFINKKDKFLLSFLNELGGKSLGLLPSKYYDSVAYSRKHYNGIVDNLNNNVRPGFGNFN